MAPACLFLSVWSFFLFIPLFNNPADALKLGLNYGMMADNLPPPDQVIFLLKSRNISSIRLFQPNATVLEALRGAGMEVVLGTLNQDLQTLADPSFARAWVQNNVVPFADSVSFRCVAAGNEVIPGDLAGHVLPAMKNLQDALKAAKLSIPVTTAVATQVLGDSFPPSQTAFSEQAGPYMAPVAAFLQTNNAPLLVNVYPYFAYASNLGLIPVDYALSTATDAVMDGELPYYSLFDAMVDSVNSALENAGAPSVEVVVSETGWPSAGNVGVATIENAKMYHNNLIAHLCRSGGTPRRPKKGVETYLFAVFNENLKSGEVEQNFGLYRPDMTEVYTVDFGQQLGNCIF